MWATIASLFFGALPTITKQIADARVQLANAKTEENRIAAEERVKTLEIRRDVLIAESRSPWNSVARFVLTAPIAFYLFLNYAWDKGVCKWLSVETQASSICTTDPLSPWLAGIAITVVGFYFVTDLTKIIKR